MTPIERISELLQTELRLKYPDSQDVLRYVQAIRELCDAQSTPNNRAYYTPRETEDCSELKRTP